MLDALLFGVTITLGLNDADVLVREPAIPTRPLPDQAHRQVIEFGVVAVVEADAHHPVLAVGAGDEDAEVGVPEQGAAAAHPIACVALSGGVVRLRVVM